MLDARQAKFFRLALDKGATEGEAVTALMKLRASMLDAGIDAHALLAAMENAGLAESQIAAAQTRARAAEARARQAEAMARSTPDPGLTVIRFGFEKGKMLKQVSPFSLRRLRAWCQERRRPGARFV